VNTNMNSSTLGFGVLHSAHGALLQWFRSDVVEYIFSPFEVEDGTVQRHEVSGYELLA
jgi:hypothetical protein